MTWPNWNELLPYLVGGGATWKWWVERRDRLSEEERAKTEALKTVERLETALTAKNEEGAAKDARILRLEEQLATQDRWYREQLQWRDQRIDELEDRLYARGGQP